MKKVILIPILTFFISCDTKTTVSNLNSDNREEKVAKFLANYDPLDFDTLAVEYNWQDSTNSKFYGTKLDSADKALFPSIFFQDYDDYFACYKTSIGESQLGLITRSPGEYSSTEMCLFVYDIKLDSVISKILLADEWADAGESYKMNSWIIRLKNQTQVFTETNYTTEDYESEELGTKTEVTRTNFLLKIHDNAIDTIAKNDSLMMRTFRKVNH